MKVHELKQLVAAMAHEVRNPLNSMAIHAELLERRLHKERDLSSSDREAALKSLGVFSHEIDRIDQILEEYMRYAGPDEVNRQSLEPRALIDEVVAQTAPLAQERQVTVTTQVAPSSSPWIIDVEALSGALEALLTNAIQASPPQSTIEVVAGRDGDLGELTVVDQGRGISRDELSQIFRLGFSQDGRAGVGLTVAKQIIKGQGGSLLVESEGRGRGAKFTIRVPVEGG